MLNQEMMQKIKNCKSAEEVLSAAKGFGLNCTPTQAEALLKVARSDRVKAAAGEASASLGCCVLICDENYSTPQNNVV